MKFAVASDQRRFFQNEGWIEFEEVLNAQQVTLFNRAIDRALIERFQLPLERVQQEGAEALFLKGHDLWRSDEDLRRLICQGHLARLVSDLLEIKTLRLSHDQLWPGYSQSQWRKAKGTYATLIDQQISLAEITCVQNLACGLLVNLGSARPLEREEEESSAGINPFVPQVGHVMAFSPKTQLNLNSIQAYAPQQRFYLIAYAYTNSTYILEPRDPHTHALKHLGYIFNDNLNDKINPVIYC